MVVVVFSLKDFLHSTPSNIICSEHSISYLLNNINPAEDRKRLLHRNANFAILHNGSQLTGLFEEFGSDLELVISSTATN